MYQWARLAKNGNSTTVTIPRPMLHKLGWTSGGFVILELNEAGNLSVRPPRERDLGLPMSNVHAPADGDGNGHAP